MTGITRMWEAVAAPGRLDDLLAHVLAAAPSEAGVYRAAGGEPRVVVIDPTGVGLAGVPADLVAGRPHEWEFEPVPRQRG
ncbi:MAG TPA: hypothetical protein VFX70_05565 [Mycobacteriales bacterium]|nr:hypothetical protein [Mycobacteriales bacterium]